MRMRVSAALARAYANARSGDAHAMVHHPSCPFVHAVPTFIAPVMGHVLDDVYAVMLPRADLVEIMNLGPFTHKLDRGLPLRKAAFTCLSTFMSQPTLSPFVAPASALPLLFRCVRSVCVCVCVCVCVHACLFLCLPYPSPSFRTCCSG
ncbi:MAG: hypothetical protein EOO41_02545, partial [Methanobacteriota archaeon]